MNSREFMFTDPVVRNALKGIRMSESDGESVNMSALPDPTVLAMAYIPMQFYKDTYETEEGFDRGTVFPELDKPFLAGGHK